MTKRLLLLTAGLGCLFPTGSAPAQPATNARSADMATIATPVLARNASINFRGEQLPTDQPGIAQRWFRTLSRQAALAGDLAVLKRRASVVFPLIEPILDEYRIPADFKYLPLLESAVTNREVSSTLR